MNKYRSPVCFLTLALAAFAAPPGFAQSATYPDRPIRLIVPFPPGGLTDNSARVIGERLAVRLGQQVVIENRSGAAGNIGTQFAAQAAPDGYTLLVGPDSTLVINPHIYPKMPFDALRDFVPISLLGVINMTVVAHPSFPARNLRELIALAKEKPGAISYGSAGIGASGHLVVEQLRLHTGMNITHIPYKGGGPAMTDVVAGQIPLVGTGLPGAIPFIRQGRVVALGVSSAERDSAVPDVPTFAESGVPGFLMLAWTGILAPIGTPRPIIERVGQALRSVLDEPDVRTRYTAIGITARSSTPEEFTELMRTDLVKWRDVIKQAGIKVE
jgi:tripartite-type tricarboxylate transporter receptor subunit TctC